MAVRATIHPGWKRKWLIVSVLLLAMGAWFGYDGYVTYPHANERAERFAQLQAEGKADQWATLAAQQGWPTEQPDKKYSSADLGIQKALMVVSIVLGLLALGHVLRMNGRFLQADDRMLTAADGREIRYEHITSIDRSRWDTKAIALVHFDSPDAGKGVVRIDDLAFANAAEVLAEVERNTGLTESAAVG